ncbi:MAG: CoA pyrophosphatase [Planctomycetota bacterium]
MPEVDEHLRRLLPAPGDWQATTMRRAAVLCPLVRRFGEDFVLVLRRPDDARQHPGQLGFPGGMRNGDESPLETALRECDEEVGVGSAHVTVLGELPHRPSSSGILVHCLVGRVADVPLRPDPREVLRVVWLPLAELRDEQRWADLPPPPPYPQPQPGQPRFLSPHFLHGEDLLWGLTGRFVRDLVTTLARASTEPGTCDNPAPPSGC